MAEAPTASKPPRARRLTRARVARVLSVVYAAATVVYVVLLRFFADRLWFATVLSFSPRWAFALAAPVVVIACIYGRAFRFLGLVLASLVVQLFWVGDLHVHACAAPKADDRAVRIVTQNAMSRPFSSHWLDELVRDERLDLALIQECPIPGEAKDVPSPVDGFYFATDINTCLLSRWPITKADPRPRADAWDRGGSGAISLYEIAAPSGPISVLNLHLTTVRPGLAGFVRYKLGGIATLRENTDLRAWEAEAAIEWAKRATGPLIIAGDFNLPRESAIYRENFGRFGSAFDACGSGFGYTKETIVEGVEFGTRIDHVLFDDAWVCSDAHLAKTIGSDHRGMVAELHLR